MAHHLIQSLFSAILMVYIRGHQELFRVANKAARKDLLPIVVMTFNESPKIALEPYHPDLFLHILNPAERERKLSVKA